jgi:two-component system chemotaxis response regulator CheB
MIKDTPISFLVIDPDTKSRSSIVRAVFAIDYATVVGQAGDYQTALEVIKRTSPEIVLIDESTPGMPLKQAIAEIKKIDRNIEVIIISDYRGTSAGSSQKALDIGAFYYVKKPKSGNPKDNIYFYRKYLRPIINLYRVNNITVHVKSTVEKPPKPSKIIRPGEFTTPTPFSNYSMVAIGSSLGGPEALKKVIPLLPGDFPVPILIVQHMPERFTADFSQNLDSISRLIVMEAQGGEVLRPGYVYVAAGGRHMTVIKDIKNPGRYRIRLNDGPFVNGCKPSIDVLLKSLAQTVTGNIMAVILTGMGKDGAEGVKTLKKQANCYCITQDQATSAVYGMPGEVSSAGLSDLSQPIHSIAQQLSKMITRQKYTEKIKR